MNVSFIIPAYNEEDNIGNCIQSIHTVVWMAKIFNPTMETEIIVVDNNSTDDTAKIALELGAIVIKEPIKGVTYARQAGYHTAKYEYQAYIDADNMIQPDWLKGLKEFNDPLVVAITGPLYLYEKSIPFRACASAFYSLNRIAHKTIGPSIQGGNYIVRKSALDQIGGHSIHIPFYGEDTDLAVRLSEVGNIKLLPSMWIYSSARRFNEQGALKTVYLYVLNYLSINLLHRPVTLEYKDYRPHDNSHTQV